MRWREYVAFLDTNPGLAPILPWVVEAPCRPGGSGQADYLQWVEAHVQSLAIYPFGTLDMHTVRTDSPKAEDVWTVWFHIKGAPMRHAGPRSYQLGNKHEGSIGEAIRSRQKWFESYWATQPGCSLTFDAAARRTVGLSEGQSMVQVDFFLFPPGFLVP